MSYDFDVDLKIVVIGKGKDCNVCMLSQFPGTFQSSMGLIIPEQKLESIPTEPTLTSLSMVNAPPPKMLAANTSAYEL
eukprot:scaffold71424_cov24-Attheya_sp.AAC.1